MSNWKELKPEDWNDNVFHAIGKEWMLITAQKDGKVNTMTASWGGMGVMWGKNVVYLMIRPQRYTKEFIDVSDSLSISFYDENFRSLLSYFGTVSGRVEDKIEKSGFHTAFLDNTPYFEEAKMVMTAQKLYVQPLQPECFLKSEENLAEKWYKEKDYHIMYICSIDKMIVKQ